MFEPNRVLHNGKSQGSTPFVIESIREPSQAQGVHKMTQKAVQKGKRKTPL